MSQDKPAAPLLQPITQLVPLPQNHVHFKSGHVKPLHFMCVSEAMFTPKCFASFALYYYESFKSRVGTREMAQWLNPLAVLPGYPHGGFSSRDNMLVSPPGSDHMG